MILILCLFLVQSLDAQELYERNLDKEKLESMRESIKHKSKKPPRWAYKDKKEWEKSQGSNQAIENKTKSKVKDYESPQKFEAKPNDFRFPNFNLGIGAQIIMYLIFGAGLAFLIYFLFINSNFKANGQKYIPIDLDDVPPSEIPLTELERLLSEALTKHDYRGAVRIYYLFILKDLSQKGWINWTKEKTNIHYINEMLNKQESGQFNTIVRYFEFIWYGKRNISQAQFKNIQPSFLTLLNTLGIK